MNRDLLALLNMLNGGSNMDSELDFAQLDQLEQLLIDANIPYERFNNFNGQQICYYGPNGRQINRNENTLWQGNGVGAICSVILSMGSYGHENGLLEISGLMTDEEYDETGDTVLGHLDAQNVFERIQHHYNQNRDI